MREYTKVTNEQRSLLIELLENNITIKTAARQAGLKYENAKRIYRVYTVEGRRTKKAKRKRRGRAQQHATVEDSASESPNASGQSSLKS